MKWSIALTTLAAFAALILPVDSHARPLDVPCPAELETVRSYSVKRIDRGTVARASVLVMKDGEITWAEGFG